MNFVIIASPRTGSTHLVTTLSGHPDIFCNGNIFKRDKLQLFWPTQELPRDRKNTLLKMRDADPDGFMKLVFNTAFGKSHVGFKIFPGQQDRILEMLIEDSDVRKIVLFRRNVLACYSSSMAAKTTGNYSLNQGNSQARVLVPFDAKRFQAFHDKYIGFYASALQRLVAVKQAFMLVQYEDLNADPVVSTLFGFLGADMAETARIQDKYRRLAKQGSTDIVSRFTNGGEVRRFLAQNDLLAWSHEAATSFSALKPREIDLTVPASN